MSRFTKLDENLAPLPADAESWSAVLDTTTDLIWTKDDVKSKAVKWDAADKACRELNLGDKTDWRLPTVEELFGLADRSRYSPAIDTDYFPDTKPDWYWSSSSSAIGSDSAWIVHFGDGNSHWVTRYNGAFVRAVRSARQ